MDSRRFENYKGRGLTSGQLYLSSARRWGSPCHRVGRIPPAPLSGLFNSLLLKTYRLKNLSHQNKVRKALHPEYYDKENLRLDKGHWDHCIESIRQSLVCSADVSPLVWQWVDRVQEVRLAGNIIHTCRNFEKIRRWALERTLDRPLNFSGFK